MQPGEPPVVMDSESRSRVVLGLEYDGSRFYGFQRQRQKPTVQEVLEDAIARVADRRVTVHCAGRTDTGVHAVCQVVHFDTEAERSERQAPRRVRREERRTRSVPRGQVRR